MRQLVVAVRNTITHLNGEIAFGVLCGAVAGSARAVRAGLDHVAAEGQFVVTFRADDVVHLAIGEGHSAEKSVLRTAYDRLRLAYEEMEAYRRFFRAQSVRRLFTR